MKIRRRTEKPKSDPRAGWDLLLYPDRALYEQGEGVADSCIRHDVEAMQLVTLQGGLHHMRQKPVHLPAGTKALRSTTPLVTPEGAPVAPPGCTYVFVWSLCESGRWVAVPSGAVTALQASRSPDPSAGRPTGPVKVRVKRRPKSHPA